MPAQIDDVTLLTYFIKGEAVLASNYQLYIQPAQNFSQLFTHTGKLIAWARHEDVPTRIGVRPISGYSDLLYKILLKHEFIPLGLNHNRQFMEYEAHPIPQGHTLKFTPTKDLWKYWWSNRTYLVGPRKEMDILVFRHHQWVAIEDLAFQTETFFLQTSKGEIALHNEDRLTWLQPDSPREPPETVMALPQLSTKSSTSLLKVAPQVNHPSVSQLRSLTAQPVAQDTHAIDAVDASCKKALGHVYRCPDGRLIVETPHGEVVIVGDRLNFFAAAADHPPATSSHLAFRSVRQT